MPDDLSRRFAEHVARHARRRPDAPALAWDGQRWSYAELEQRVEAYARGLLARDVAPGEVVAVFGTSHPDCLVAFLACCRVGAVYLGLSPKHTPRELGFVVRDARPRLVLATDPASAPFEAEPVEALLDAGDLAPAEVSPERPCAIVYTSGSTGLPKGALLSQRAIVRSALLTLEHWYGGAEDIRTVAQHPINHVSWLVCECAPVLLGGGTLFFRERFDAGATLRLIAHERLNLWFAFPAAVALAVQSEEFERCDLSSLRRVAFGSLPRLDLLRRLRARTQAVCTVSYGLTEAAGGALLATADDDGLETVASSLGRALPGVEARVVDPDGRGVPEGEPGELLIRDESVFLGYLDRPEATAQALDGSGWLHTGDAVVRGPDGRFRLVGRLKEMFKSGGYNVYPTEVEGVIGAHPAVDEVAVVEAPDPVWTEVGVAFLVWGGGATADVRDVDEFARARLANYKVPKRFVVEDRLPRLPNGKPDRVVLRERARQAVQPERAIGGS